MKKTKRPLSHIWVWLRRLLLAVVGLVLGIQLFQWNANTLAGNQLPMPFGFGTAVVMSGSMEPTLSVNDLVIIKAEDSYQVGDIIVYQSGSSLVIHRIVEFRDDLVIAKGDANNKSDEPFRDIYIKGKLAVAIPGVGGVARLTKSPVVTFLLIGGAVALMEGSFRREKKKDQDDIEKIKEEIRRLKAEQE